MPNLIPQGRRKRPRTPRTGRRQIRQPHTENFNETRAMAQKTRSIEITQVTEWKDGTTTRLGDYLAAEEPLEMRSGRFSLGITLRTPGDDEELVAGFLFTEGIITGREDIVALKLPADGAREKNVARLTFGPKVRLSANSAAKRFSAGSACGVCGKASIAQLRRRGLRRPKATAPFDPEMLCQLPPKLRAAQDVFGRTGGLHAAALFGPGGDLLVLREDIGRHNAVDKVIGWA